MAFRKRQPGVPDRRLQVPPDPASAAELAGFYREPELGFVRVTHAADGLWFDFGGFRSRMGARRAADGTVHYAILDAGAEGFEFQSDMLNGQRALTIRLGQHSYTYVEIRDHVGR